MVLKTVRLAYNRAAFIVIAFLWNMDFHQKYLVKFIRIACRRNQLITLAAFYIIDVLGHKNGPSSLK